MDENKVQSSEPTDQEFEQAQQEIAVAEDFIETMVKGIRQYEFFDQDVPREVKIATMAQMVHQVSDDGGAILVAAVAIVKVAEMKGSLQV